MRWKVLSIYLDIYIFVYLSCIIVNALTNLVFR